MPVSVVIPTVRPTYLEATLASICRQTCVDWEMIVVAQGNDPELKAFVDKGYPDSRVRFVHLQDKGLSLARNAGMEAAAYPLVLFTDDDCEAQEDWISVVTECFETYPEVWLVGGALIAPPKPRWKIASCPQVHPLEVVYDPAETFATPPKGWGWVGGNFAARREVYEKIGPFDTFSRRRRALSCCRRGRFRVSHGARAPADVVHQPQCRKSHLWHALRSAQHDTNLVQLCAGQRGDGGKTDADRAIRAARNGLR